VGASARKTKKEIKKPGVALEEVARGKIEGGSGME
jgi:DNA-directed RNA polymerase subunit K/omega